MRIFKNTGLSLKIVLSIFSTISLIFLGIFLYNYFVSKDIIVKNIEESATNLTVSTVNKVDKILAAVEKVPQNVAVLIENSGYSSEKIHKLLELVVQNNDDIYGATIAFEPYTFDKDSLFFAPYYYKQNDSVKLSYLGGEEYNYFLLDWYQIPKELDRPIWSEPYYDEGGGNILMCTYSVPFYRYEKGKRVFWGIITADMSLDWLQNIINSIKVFQTGYGFVISKTGRFISHPSKGLIMNESVFSVSEERGIPFMRVMGRDMIAGKSGIVQDEYKNVATGKQSWISYAPIKTNNWAVGIVYPVNELMADVYSFNKTVLLLGLIGGIVLLGVIILISRSITSPLRKLAAVTIDFGKGNFDVELPQPKSNDEIGLLNKSFVSMQDALRKTILQLKNANDELEEYSRTLEEKVEQRTVELKQKNIELDAAFNNVKALSDIGQKITSTLNLELIFYTVYESVNSLLDASVFLIMIYNKEKNSLDCKLSIEKGEKLPEFSFGMEEENRFAVWSVVNKKPIYMNDVDVEYSRYISHRIKPKAGDYAASMLYYPLVVEGRVIGTVSVQSFKKNAYTPLHVDILSNLASYTAIALDNAYAYEAINKANKELKEAQSQLIQAEKMASLGQLTAGIAHEIKNPLNFVNNFADLCVDLTHELKDELEVYKDKIGDKEFGYITEILGDIEQNSRKINEHGKRADSIVKGMLLHSRGKAGELQKSDINSLLNEYINLAYHGFRAQDTSFNIKIETEFDKDLEPINIVPQNLSRAFLNIINNACYSVHEKKREKGNAFNPVLHVSTRNADGRVEVKIKDNGKGIPEEIVNKIFNPFFTTKPTGKGTGLGLSMTYDIITQEHKGEIQVKTETGEFAEFTISIPKDLK
ncbi:MAG TPA: cache domain-containing protein [Ignavibacteriaceae bacterium]|jgi:signal transduction histidine kinase|nr:cache domain-containing protein [Ignavibacteriaceae bacterium]